MTRGERPEVRRNELPLTRMAESAISGQSSIDVDGYNDYRGVPVVGAWRWLENYGFGVASETDVAEAYRPLTILKVVFWSMMGLLVLCSIGLLIFAIVAAKLQRDARMAAIEAKQLGQYKLEDKLGEGAMGVFIVASMRCCVGPRRSSCSMPTRSTTTPSPALSAKCRRPVG